MEREDESDGPGQAEGEGFQAHAGHPGETQPVGSHHAEGHGVVLTGGRQWVAQWQGLQCQGGRGNIRGVETDQLAEEYQEHTGGDGGNVEGTEQLL